MKKHLTIESVDAALSKALVGSPVYFQLLKDKRQAEIGHSGPWTPIKQKEEKRAK